MALIVGNSAVQANSTSFKILNGSNTSIFEQGMGNTYAYATSGNVPMFCAGYPSDVGAVYCTGTPNKIGAYCSITSFNIGGHYNTSTTRFTAPITGPYWFSYSAYQYTDTYMHPLFFVNGGGAGGGRLNFPYRIRSYGFTANYQNDLSIEETIYLTAGDFVEVYVYAYGASYFYPYYANFNGVYLG